MTAAPTKSTTRWVKRSLRGSEVWARVDESGGLVSSDGRVDVLYKLASGAKVYRAAVRNLEPDPGGDGDRMVELALAAAPVDSGTATGTANGLPARASARDSRAATRPAARTGARHSDSRGIPANAIVAYTDGGCSPNPGPGGIGVVLRDGPSIVELSEYQGESTNNICELRAIERALETISLTDRARRTVVIYADSEYAINLLAAGWKAKANVELVARLRKLAATFSDLRFVKVLAHSGVPDNERADVLVAAARAKARR